MEVKERYYKALLIAQGIKKRCRKIDRHYFEMGTMPLQPTTELEDMIKESKKVIADNMKETKQATLTLHIAQFDGRFEQVHILSPDTVRYQISL